MGAYTMNKYIVSTSFLLFILFFSSSLFAQSSEKEGLICIKKGGPIEKTIYIGLTNIKQTQYTALRTESIALFGKQKQDMGTSLELDDGKQTQIIAWQGDILLTLDEGASKYSPSDFKATLAKSKSLYGTCQTWQVDAKKLQKPDIDGIE